MGGTASRETPQSRPAPAAVDTLAKKRLASPETFVRVLTSNDAYSAILAYSGFERVLKAVKAHVTKDGIDLNSAIADLLQGLKQAK